MKDEGIELIKRDRIKQAIIIQIDDRLYNIKTEADLASEYNLKNFTKHIAEVKRLTQECEQLNIELLKYLDDKEMI